MKINQSFTERTDVVDGYLREISKIPMITPEEEVELAERISHGDEDALRKLVEANLRFVVSVSKQYQGKGMALSDIINEGNVGLITAARRFDPSKGFKFISYAVWWIRQNIIQALSSQSRVVRLPLNQVATLAKIGKVQSKFLQENQREPSAEELAEFIDLTPEKLEEALGQGMKSLSVDCPFGEDEDGTLLDIIPANEESTSTDAITDAQSLSTDIDLVLLTLAPRERDIVRSSFGIGCTEMSLEEIADKYDLTRERVRQLKEKALRKLRSPQALKLLKAYL